MIFWVAAVAALGLAGWADWRGAGRLAAWMRLALYATLAAWVWAEAGARAFRGSETSLLGWFIFGLGALALGEALGQWGARRLAPAAVPLAALCFAMGFDVLRPDEYAAAPAGILGILVALLALAVYRTLLGGIDRAGATRLTLLGYTVALAVLVYAGTYKVVDRGWALPWSYMAAGGVLLTAASRLWWGWGAIFGKQPVAPWQQRLAFGLGVLLMAASAVFVYREFL